MQRTCLTLQSLDLLSTDLSRDDPVLQLEAIKLLRKQSEETFSSEVLDKIRQAVLPRLLHCLSLNAELQVEVGWVLANLACWATAEQTDLIIEMNIVEAFISQLQSQEEKVRHPAFNGLGILAGHTCQTRDRILEALTLSKVLVEMEQAHSGQTARAATYLMTRLCQGRPLPDWNLVRPCLPVFARLVLNSPDLEVLTDACWGLFYLAGHGSGAIHQLLQLEPHLSLRLVELLSQPHETPVLLAVLGAVGGIAKSSGDSTQSLIEAGLLPVLSALLRRPEADIQKVVCSIISCTADSPAQIQAMRENDLLAPLVPLLTCEDCDTRDSALMALCNAALGGSQEQIQYLVSLGGIEPLCQLWCSSDAQPVRLAVKALGAILEACDNAGVPRDPALIRLIVDRISGADPQQQLQATYLLRKAFSNPNESDQVILAGVVPRLIQFLSSGHAELQFEACWVLINVLAGTGEPSTQLTELGALEALTSLLDSKVQTLQVHAVWALGNLVSGNDSNRERLLQLGTLQKVLTLLQTTRKTAAVRKIILFLASMCRGRPIIEIARVCLPVFYRFVLRTSDLEVLEDACWGLVHLADNGVFISAALNPGVCAHLAQHLLELPPEATVLIVVLRAIGCLVAGSPDHTQALINAGGLPALLGLLKLPKPHPDIRRAVCWIVSSIAAGGQDQIQALIDHRLFAAVLPLLGGRSTLAGAAETFAAAATHGSPEQIEYLVLLGCVQALCRIWRSGDSDASPATLKALEAILRAGQPNEKLHYASENIHLLKLGQAVGLSTEGLAEPSGHPLLLQLVERQRTYLWRLFYFTVALRCSPGIAFTVASLAAELTPLVVLSDMS